MPNHRLWRLWLVWARFAAKMCSSRSTNVQQTLKYIDTTLLWWCCQKCKKIWKRTFAVCKVTKTECNDKISMLNAKGRLQKIVIFKGPCPVRPQRPPCWCGGPFGLKNFKSKFRCLGGCHGSWSRFYKWKCWESGHQVVTRWSPSVLEIEVKIVSLF